MEELEVGCYEEVVEVKVWKGECWIRYWDFGDGVVLGDDKVFRGGLKVGS